MATDFWASSHYKRWIVDRAAVQRARAEDRQYVDDPEYLDFLGIFFANAISKLGKKLGLRQRVIATATVFFRRFYLKNSYCETDPFLVIAACCYVASKAEESPVHIKNVVSEARSVFSQDMYGIKTFPSDNSKLAEMEFYLVDDLECDMTIFHPYRTLMTLCCKEGSSSDFDTEAGELGVGVNDGPRYWGTGEGKLELPGPALQMAWFIINDTYRSELCLLYPPHMIAVAVINLTLVLHNPTRTSIQNQSAPAQAAAPRRSSRQASNHTKKPAQDPISFLASLNVSMTQVATIMQEIIALYTLWDRYKEESPSGETSRGSLAGQQGSPFTTSSGGTKRSATGVSRSGSVNTSSGSNGGTPMDTREEGETGEDGKMVVTPTLLSRVLRKMREAKLADLARGSGPGRPMAVNKMIGRAQAAG
ncbi:cyclin-like protein [Gloeophyllum trabeum ATCC 11539]|uniref:Cyclin-like protein n=1 Tax=Gloeophyllum trabeum (strain ATCC 11539 / FP-39264 / Madison 617) TaxID=670483 RepID=S7QJE3_GLOTA|nr:cyclin-like protein [Gloeophyllum trabeum ATCC 11539]EPQ59791.1 cyclin-like protein [Gloeophyllum trabeum ATCC 11539]